MRSGILARSSRSVIVGSKASIERSLRGSSLSRPVPRTSARSPEAWYAHAGNKRRPQPFGIREQIEDPLAVDEFAGRAPVLALELGARGFDQPVVLHAGGAGGHAGHAAQAPVEMLDVAVGEPGFAFGAQLHQVDAPAGRIHLFAPQRVGGAGGQAEAAVDALVVQFRCRRIVIVENGGGGLVGSAVAIRSPLGSVPGSESRRDRSAA